MAMYMWVPSFLGTIISVFFYCRLVRQVLHLEGFVAAIMGRLDLVMEKLELHGWKKGTETMIKVGVKILDVCICTHCVAQPHN